MRTIIIEHADNSTAEMLETLAKKLGLSVKTKLEKSAEKSPYDPKFVAKIKKGEAEVKAGKTHKIKLGEIWK